LDIHTI